MDRGNAVAVLCAPLNGYGNGHDARFVVRLRRSCFAVAEDPYTIRASLPSSALLPDFYLIVQCVPLHRFPAGLFNKVDNIFPGHASIRCPTG